MSRPAPYEAVIPSMDPNSPAWTKEGSLDLPDDIWILLATAITVMTMQTITMDIKKGYF